ncbi:hypothetical protein cypCar_00032245 [Cyprinus carpio]|nr:hypothetical protein cypCar_00032245 [Cyprinus carpio]
MHVMSPVQQISRISYLTVGGNNVPKELFAIEARPPVQQGRCAAPQPQTLTREQALRIMGTRLKVLRVFKDLHKTRRDVFRDDDRALTVLRPRKSLLLDNVPYSDTPRNKT